ncbi:DUF3861 domain-containing protein [Pedobacter endophyticus]|uniref:DUF3861 domain-containing protein n=1 Tax=Pedobacter endophyticus TaxID=2789740 RepID=A0A7U3SNQ7_9SPHI|nr:DUF3861 domain-containing protein [Pedobacter endophyticus]QPH37698.1 DUF3861 domain-containing protein [Pedobacter endophyticus]
MEKRTNKYKLTLEEISLAKDSDAKNDPIMLEFDNHDNLFNIIKAVKSKAIFDNENEAAEFAIGLKMFTEVMLKNRSNDLFKEVQPAIGEFMKKLKNT